MTFKEITQKEVETVFLSHNELSKEIVHHEINNVFLNTNEFAENIELDGRHFKAVVIRDGAVLNSDEKDDRQLVSYEMVTIHCNKLDVQKMKLIPEKRVSFNGESWFVYSCIYEDLVILQLYKERV